MQPILEQTGYKFAGTHEALGFKMYAKNLEPEKLYVLFTRRTEKHMLASVVETFY